jgi:hypothetical protein
MASLISVLSTLRVFLSKRMLMPGPLALPFATRVGVKQQPAEAVLGKELEGDCDGVADVAFVDVGMAAHGSEMVLLATHTTHGRLIMPCCDELLG